MKYKMWIILLEEVNYTAENIFNISYNSIIENFSGENPKSLFDDWKKDGSLVEKRMVYNMFFLNKIESFLIKNGIFFNWIIYKDNYIGIRIQPSKIDFSNLFKDCMTLEKFSWHRASYMNIPNKMKENE